MTKDNPHKKSYYGWECSKCDHRDYKFSTTVKAPIYLPDKVDLRRGMLPVMQQESIGSCTACSSIAMVEYLIKKNYPKRRFRPSVLAQYYWTRKLEGNQKRDSGAEMRTSLKSLNKFGAAHSKLWPYRTKKFAIAPNKKTRIDAKRHRVVEYRRLDQNLKELKTCLAMGFPFIFGFWVYESFEREAGKGFMPQPNVKKERFLGGHACAIVGYNNLIQAFLVRNSWGRRWGLRGHFWMPYELVLDPTISQDFWTAKMVTMPPVRKPKPKPKRKPKPKPKRKPRPQRKPKSRRRPRRPNGRLRV